MNAIAETEEETRFGWHFATDAGTTNAAYSGAAIRITAGTVFESPGTPFVCGPFPHCCYRAIDALVAGHGCVVSYVAVSGLCVVGEQEKVAVNRRKPLWVADASAALHEFACWCAERALTVANVEDERCWKAIEAKRPWLRGEISDDLLDAAWDAARAAAWDAARAEQNAELERLLWTLPAAERWCAGHEAEGDA